MADLTKQKNQDKWTDDLLIKDTSGQVHPFKDKGSSEKPSVLSSLKPIESIIQKMEASINTAPADDSFNSLPNISGSSGAKADFIFHPDDKEQLEEVAKNMPKDTSHKYSIEKIVNRLIEKQGLKFDKANKDFFTNVIFDFFRNRKKIISVRDLLSNQVFIGKNKLSEDIVDSVLSVIKGIKNKISTVGGLVVRMEDMPPQPMPPKTKPEFKLPEEKPVKAKPVPEPVKVPKPPKKPEFELPSAPVVKAKIKVPKPAPTPKLDEETKPIEVKLSKTDTTALPKVIRPGAQVAKQQITDVVKPQPPKEETVDKKIASKKILTSDKSLSGPIEELKAMTLSNFRYLGDSAQERIEKILEKIKFLEKDGYTKKALGIDAWRQSKVYQMYLDLGADSMVQNKEVANLIDEHEKGGKETLSVAEFSGISDLNKQLRF
jgi:hypothetical protein